MRKFLRCILAIVILITATYTFFGYTEEQNDNEVYENADQYIEVPTLDPNAVVEINPNETDFAGDLLLEYQKDYDWDSLLTMNDEIVGWLDIPNNEIINFPVVQGINNKFYLSHDYTKNYNGNGNAFVDYRYNKFCLNKVIYGHNMNLTSTHPVFTTVMNWKDKEYFDSHRTLYYTEANGITKEYLIVAISHFNVAAEKEHSYLDMRFNTEEEFRSWLKYIEEHSTYFDLGDNTVDYRADEVIVLSTCDRKLGYGSNGRTILFCINLTNNLLTEEMN